ncbi:MAG: HAD family hydrolase [Roseburia sp.]
MVKNVILDVGKVLVEWEPDIAFQKLGFDAATSRIVSAATVYSKDWDEVDRSEQSDEALLAKLISNAPEYEREIRLVWENIGFPIRQYDYAKNWILAMKQRGLGVYILSNYSRFAYENTAEALSFLAHVDGAVFSFQVHRIKPEPEIYRALLDQYNLNPQECVFIDDREVNLKAAKAQGIAGIHFTSYEEAIAKLREYGVEC